MGASLYLAFTDYDILTAPRWIGLENFHRMFTQDRRYLQSVTVTLFYVAVAVPLRLAFALALAMLLNTQRRGMAVYRAAYLRAVDRGAAAWPWPSCGARCSGRRAS